MNLECHYRTSRVAFNLEFCSVSFIIFVIFSFVAAADRTSHGGWIRVQMLATVVYSGGLLLAYGLKFFNERIIISPDGITWIDKFGRVKMAVEASRIVPNSYRGNLFGPPMPSHSSHGRCKLETEVGTIKFDENISNYYFLCRACAQFAGQTT